MTKAIAIALLVGGVVLIVIGVNAMNSFSSDISRFFSGTPTDKSIWILFGGILSAVAGLTLAVRGWKEN